MLLKLARRLYIKYSAKLLQDSESDLEQRSGLFPNRTVNAEISVLNGRELTLFIGRALTYNHKLDALANWIAGEGGRVYCPSNSDPVFSIHPTPFPTSDHGRLISHILVQEDPSFENRHVRIELPYSDSDNPEGVLLLKYGAIYDILKREFDKRVDRFRFPD